MLISAFGAAEAFTVPRDSGSAGRADGRPGLTEGLPNWWVSRD